MKLSHAIAGIILLSINSFSGTIIASGDSSIAVSLTGGNATFFSNILGSGQTVLVQELDPGTAGFGANIANYYAGSGVAAFQTTQASGFSLFGIDLFISMLPQTDYSATDLAAMSSFLSGGGTIFFIGESSGYSPGNVADPIITNTLGLLGSTMTMSGNDGSLYPVNAVVLSDPLTAGVGTFTYGFTSFVDGGTPLFDTNPANTAGSPFIEAQTVGSATPEPVSGALTLAGLAGLGLLARRKKLS